MNENNLGKGAIALHPFHRFINKKLCRRKFKNLGKGLPFDWTKGYDVRDSVGSITIKNQGTNDSCGGQSGSYFLEIQRKLQKINEGAISAKSIYSPIFYPGGGTTIADLERQICTKGGNLDASVTSYDALGEPLIEELMEDTSWQTAALIQDAFTRSGYTSYVMELDIDVMAGTIEDWGSGIIEIQGQNGHTPGWESPYPVPPSSDNKNPIWSHFLCICGAKMINGTKYLIALESEGTSWGDNGVQYISEDYIKSGYVVDAFTCCFDPKIVPVSDNFSPLANIWRYFMLWRSQWKSS